MAGWRDVRGEDLNLGHSRMLFILFTQTANFYRAPTKRHVLSKVLRTQRKKMKLVGSQEGRLEMQEKKKGRGETMMSLVGDVLS